MTTPMITATSEPWDDRLAAECTLRLAGLAVLAGPVAGQPAGALGGAAVDGGGEHPAEHAHHNAYRLVRQFHDRFIRFQMIRAARPGAAAARSRGINKPRVWR
jgi:hypothetical protein